MTLFADLIQEFGNDQKIFARLSREKNKFILDPLTNFCMGRDSAIQVYQALAEKYETGQLIVNDGDWHKNEKRLFAWFLINYVIVKSLQMDQIIQRQWKVLGEVFFQKDWRFLKFQGLSLQKKVERHNWSSEEDLLITKSVQSYGLKNWGKISKQIYYLTQDNIFVSAKQCRERWINHLNSKMNKSHWKEEEDRQLFSLYNKFGKKWAKISRAMSTVRNEHMVKNRFNSIKNTLQKQPINHKKSQKQIIDQLLEKYGGVTKQIQIQQEPIEFEFSQQCSNYIEENPCAQKLFKNEDEIKQYYQYRYESQLLNKWKQINQDDIFGFERTQIDLFNII